MRPEIAASLQSIQTQLGDSLGGVLEEQPTAPKPSYHQTLVLEHISGLQSGGALPLTVGSYRFGRASGSMMLDAGKPHDPQFGLTIDPAGTVTLYPPPTGVLLDGVKVVEPEPMQVGQVISVGHNRFGLRPQSRLAVSRTSNSGELSEMPTPSRGRNIDQAVVGWVAEHRERTLRTMWSGLVSSVELHQRVTDNELFGLDRQSPMLGQVLLGTADVPFRLPEEVSSANKATVAEIESRFTVLPGAPVCVDLKQESLAIIGPREQGRAVATWLTLSLAVLSDPKELGIAVFGSADPASWSWVDRLPHSSEPTSSGVCVNVIDEKRLGEVPPAGAIVLLEPGSPVPESVGAALEIHPESAVFASSSLGLEDLDVAAIGVANAVAVERSLVISQHTAAGG